MKKFTLGIIENDACNSDFTYEQYTDILWHGLFKVKGNKYKTRQLAKDLSCTNKWYEIYNHLHSHLFSHIISVPPN